GGQAPPALRAPRRSAEEVHANAGTTAHLDLARLLNRLTVVLPAGEDLVGVFLPYDERWRHIETLRPFLLGGVAVKEDLGIGRHDEGDLCLRLLDRLARRLGLDYPHRWRLPGAVEDRWGFLPGPVETQHRDELTLGRRQPV